MSNKRAIIFLTINILLWVVIYSLIFISLGVFIVSLVMLISGEYDNMYGLIKFVIAGVIIDIIIFVTHLIFVRIVNTIGSENEINNLFIE